MMAPALGVTQMTRNPAFVISRPMIAAAVRSGTVKVTSAPPIGNFAGAEGSESTTSAVVGDRLALGFEITGKMTDAMIAMMATTTSSSTMVNALVFMLLERKCDVVVRASLKRRLSPCTCHDSHVNRLATENGTNPSIRDVSQQPVVVSA